MTHGSNSALLKMGRGNYEENKKENRRMRERGRKEGRRGGRERGREGGRGDREDEIWGYMYMYS